MKKASKVLSIVLVLAMLCSLFALSASAAEPATISLSATQTSSSPDIYKVTVSTQCDYTLQNMNMILLYDKTAFKLIRNTGIADTSASNANGYKKEGDMADDNLYDGSISHPVFGDSIDQFNPDYGYANGVGSGSFTFQVKPAAAAYGTLSQDTWQAMLFDWTANFDDNALLFDCRAEATPVFSFYLQKLDTAQPGNYEVGIITGCKVPVIVYDPSNAIDSYSTTDGLKADINVENAFINIGEEVAGPVVAKSKAEVKMTPNSPTTVEDAFQFRVTSVITDADWDTYFANTAAGGNNAITKLGFVAYKGTAGFDMETAKSVAKGGTAAGYDVATTTYVQKETDSSDAYFGAIIQITSAETRSDATYIAYVEYTDAEGATQYAFYDAAQTALLDTNYQTIVDSYLAAYPFAG